MSGWLCPAKKQVKAKMDPGGELFSRTALLLGKSGLQVLAEAKVAVFGLGGVGSFTVEALARSGVGHLVLVDHDLISPSNINRQVHALHSTVGQAKAAVMAGRVKDINPQVRVTSVQRFYGVTAGEEIITPELSYVVDAVDTVKGKLAIILQAKQAGVPVVSALGAGNKLDPTRFEVTDIYATAGDPLARVMRRELRRRGVDNLKVVYSAEPPVKLGATDGTKILGSVAFVPPVVGLILAAVVVRDLTGRFPGR
ncbi:MAG: tRNA threonylcarbamoyladenosine dehydratase [Heliobacteriaceae bacterium]|nr:tRNA threonylcarbamoyladenosine dehydratase [Heliobacteriaceae bacterium]MDD4587122.1 tRNA threonylcarbamoyladenosine dehydratase [Heliobacteriaceae bacterium]